MKAALYARFSTEKQRELSIDDQIRVCRDLCRRDGFEVVGIYKDQAISGGTHQRPGYQALLAAARAGQFQVIVSEDLKRLWRSQPEQAPRLAELSDIGVHVVTCSGLDSRSESFPIVAPLLGAFAELDRKEAAYRTKRGLTGNATRGEPTGGKAYGYRRADKGLEIDPDQAVIIRELFEKYAAGHSPLALARDLNAREIPAPGASWSRVERRRDGSWMPSAILAILGNDRYTGRIVWNRSRWIRSARDSKKRRRVPNPESEWIVRIDESQRIVSGHLWQAVKDRQAVAHRRVGERISQGWHRTNAGRLGRQPQYPLSGLLRCKCGSTLTMRDARSYQCAGSLAGACDSRHAVRRDVATRAILAGTQDALLKSEIVSEIATRVRRALAKPLPKRDFAAERARLKREIDNLVSAIADGGLQSSSALAQRLRSAEDSLRALNQESEKTGPISPARLLTGLEGRIRARIADLASIVQASPERARMILTQTVGDRIEVVFDPQKGHLVAELEIDSGRLLVGDGRLPESLVAGA